MRFYVTSTSDFGEHQSETILIGSQDNDLGREIIITQSILDSHEIITVNACSFINYCFRQKLSPPSRIIDVFQIYKLVEGKSCKYNTQSEAAYIIDLAISLSATPENIREIKEAIELSTNKIRETGSLSLLVDFHSFFKLVFRLLSEQLSKKNEYNRFFQVEKPLNELLLRRQYQGIIVDTRLLHSNIDHADIRQKEVNKKLRYDYGLYDSKNIFEIGKILDKRGYTFFLGPKNSKISGLS